MFKNICVVLGLAAVCINKANAISDDELIAYREIMRPLINECGPKTATGPAELKAAQQANSIEGLNNCFLGCLLQKFDIINSEGMFVPEKNIELFTSILGSPEDKVKYTNLSRKCASVNDRPVTDGNAGCERAKMVLMCEFENGFDRSLLRTVSF